MKRYKEQGLEVSQAQELLLPWSWSALPSWHMDAFTDLKLLEPLHLGFFLEVALSWLIKPLATPQPLPSMEVKGRKLFHPSSHFTFLYG